MYLNPSQGEIYQSRYACVLIVIKLEVFLPYESSVIRCGRFSNDISCI